MPGDLVVRRIRWSIFAHTVGIVIGRSGDSATVWWMPTPEWQSIVTDHVAEMLIVVDESSAEELKARCLMAQ